MGETTVAGCGIIGLTTAVTLLEAGRKVTIVAGELPPRTTSDRAGALCFPFKAGPPGRCLAWAGVSMQVYSGQAADPAEPVTEVDCLVLSSSPSRDIPWQMARLGPERLCEASPRELPPGYASGHVIRVPLMQTGKYLKRLMERFLAGGGRILARRLKRLEDAPGDEVANCTGLGAAALVGDDSMAPISGHIVKVKPLGPVRCIMDEDGPMGLRYVFPRPDVCVLGGTAVQGDASLAVDPDVADSVLERTLALEPALAGAEVLERYVCLRPWRPEVRLEAGTLADGRPVVHNYGHGGSGWTLAWGCAQEAASLLP